MLYEACAPLVKDSSEAGADVRRTGLAVMKHNICIISPSTTGLAHSERHRFSCYPSRVNFGIVIS
jgi:hypothetical protein